MSWSDRVFIVGLACLVAAPALLVGDIFHDTWPWLLIHPLSAVVLGLIILGGALMVIAVVFA